MTRFEAFLNLKDDLHYGQYFEKLSKTDLIHCEEFLHQNKEVDKNEFVRCLHRRLIDPNVKRSKNHILIDELLAVANQNIRR